MKVQNECTFYRFAYFFFVHKKKSISLSYRFCIESLVGFFFFECSVFRRGNVRIDAIVLGTLIEGMKSVCC